MEPWLVERIADEARSSMRRKDSKAVVAIHCSYGFNRTGFALCSYLATHDGMDIDDALQPLFEKARPPGVKHGHFSEELKRRFPGRELTPSPVQNIQTPENNGHNADEEDPGSLSEPPLATTPVSRRGSRRRPGPASRAAVLARCGPTRVWRVLKWSV